MFSTSKKCKLSFMSLALSLTESLNHANKTYINLTQPSIARLVWKSSHSAVSKTFSLEKLGSGFRARFANNMYHFWALKWLYRVTQKVSDWVWLTWFGEWGWAVTVGWWNIPKLSQPNPDPRTSGTTQPPKLKALEAPRIRSKDCNFESFDLLCISIPLTNTTDDYIYLDTSFNK